MSWTRLFTSICDKCFSSPSKVCGNHFSCYCHPADKRTNKQTVCHTVVRVVLFWVFVLWLPVLFWKVTLLSFQVTCSSSCVIRLIASPDSWLYPPVPLYPHVSYSLCLPLSCSTVHPSPLPQSLSRPSLDLLVGNSVFFCLFKSDFFVW